MNRVVIFAHYDNSCEIKDYVVYYLKALRKITDKIIFVSDTDLKETELNKISKYVLKSIAKRHGEYDFGSYKRGFKYAKENLLLDSCEELVFANDSCYGPLFALDNLFNEMSAINVDFWGITANCARIRHIQSYFITFKPQVFNSKIFLNFIENITREADKGNVISKYEIGLTRTLVDAGFKSAIYCKSSEKHYSAELERFDKLIIKDKCPFLKRKVMLYKYVRVTYPLFVKQLITKHSNYPYEIMKKDIDNNKENLSTLQHLTGILKTFRKRIFKLNTRNRCFMLFGIWITLK